MKNRNYSITLSHLLFQPFNFSSNHWHLSPLSCHLQLFLRELDMWPLEEDNSLALPFFWSMIYQSIHPSFSANLRLSLGVNRLSRVFQTSSSSTAATLSPTGGPQGTPKRVGICNPSKQALGPGALVQLDVPRTLLRGGVLEASWSDVGNNSFSSFERQTETALLRIPFGCLSSSPYF